ncbi:hypothetical protein ABK040_016886 [Willaertia magna]
MSSSSQTLLLSLPDELFSVICLFMDDEEFLNFQKVSKSIVESTKSFIFFKERLLNKFKYWKDNLEQLSNHKFSLQKMLQNEETVKYLYKSSLSKYLIVGKDKYNGDWMTAIQNYCKKLGLKNIDVFDTEKDVPHLKRLKKYSSILIVGDHNTFIDSDRSKKFSEELCKYLLNGYGGVVVNVFANCSIVTNGYLKYSFEDFHPIQPTTQTSSDFKEMKMFPANSNYEDHFLLMGYKGFCMGSINWDHSHGQLLEKNKEFDKQTIECIARFGDVEKIPSIATRILPLNLTEKYFPNHLKYIENYQENNKERLTGRICELNFFPVDGWCKMSEASKLIVNALLYCSCLLKNK